MIEGKLLTWQQFYWIEGEGASGAALPTLMMVIPLMVQSMPPRAMLWMMTMRLTTMNRARG